MSHLVGIVSNSVATTLTACFFKCKPKIPTTTHKKHNKSKTKFLFIDKIEKNTNIQLGSQKPIHVKTIMMIS